MTDARDDTDLVDSLKQAAEIAAQATFGPFADDPDSPFAASEELDLTAEQTWQAIASQMPLTLSQAISAAVYRLPLSVDLVRSWHQILFGATFPDYAGVFHEDRERGQYAATIGGTRESPIVRTYAGTMGRRIYRELREACQAFDAAATAEDTVESGSVRSAVAEPAKLYARVLRIHPFLDGNGRPAYVVLLYTLARMNLPSVLMDDYAEHQFALGQAVRRDEKRSDLPLSLLLADKITGERT